MADLAKRIYKVFDTAPLRPDQQELYVDLHEVRGDADVVSRLASRIEFDDDPTCQVLAGHRGSGKSTELLRLKQRLEAGDAPRPFVVVVETDKDVDRNDVDFPQILMSVVRQTAGQLKGVGIDLKPGYFADRVRRVQKLLTTPIELDEVGLDAGLATLSATMKASPDAREQINKLLEPDTNNWINAANDVLGDATLQLSKLGRGRLVILVDDLDKMTVRTHPDAGCMTDEYLFVHRAPQLTSFLCDVVYAMPVSLAYSHLAAEIRRSYGGDEIPVVPMVKVRHKPPSTERYEPGIEKFRQLADARCRSASAGRHDVFADNATLDDLIALSGGQPSELMSLVRQSIVSGRFPLDAEAVRRARVAGQREASAWLRSEHWPLIEQVRETGEYHRTERTEPIFRQLLDGRAVLQYVNDKRWYGLNPFVADLEPPPFADVE